MQGLLQHPATTRTNLAIDKAGRRYAGPASTNERPAASREAAGRSARYSCGPAYFARSISVLRS